MDLWIIIPLAIVLIIVFLVVSMRTLHRENRNELRDPTPDSFGDNPEPPAGPGR